jgi:hypothetical protein
LQLRVKVVLKVLPGKLSVALAKEKGALESPFGAGQLAERKLWVFPPALKTLPRLKERPVT